MLFKLFSRRANGRIDFELRRHFVAWLGLFGLFVHYRTYPLRCRTKGWNASGTEQTPLLNEIGILVPSREICPPDPCI